MSGTSSSDIVQQRAVNVSPLAVTCCADRCMAQKRKVMVGIFFMVGILKRAGVTLPHISRILTTLDN
jgi:hypothetical protein